MRLIDADALNKELQQRVGSPTEDKLYEVNLSIIEAPTIAAIPVEWLRQEAMKDDGLINSVILGLFMKWQKEQEGV